MSREVFPPTCPRLTVTAMLLALLSPGGFAREKTDWFTYTANIYHRNAFAGLPSPLLLLDLLIVKALTGTSWPPRPCAGQAGPSRGRGPRARRRWRTQEAGGRPGRRAPAPALQAGNPPADLGPPCLPFLKLRGRPCCLARCSGQDEARLPEPQGLPQARLPEAQRSA